jgi:hypothetical protein
MHQAPDLNGHSVGPAKAGVDCVDRLALIARIGADGKARAFREVSSGVVPRARERNRSCCHCEILPVDT